MKRAVFTGSFDPVTFGHVDLIHRSSKIFDELIVLVMINENKKSFFSISEREMLLKDVTKEYGNVKVSSYSGLLADYVKTNEIDVIVRGVRSVTDFEYELQMAQTNRILSEGTDTVFLTTNPKYSIVSSSMVKEVASFGGDISKFVPKVVCENILKKINSV